ncbi:MAG: hypothetical protein A2751_05655 [Candidatus Doudnabacteria bacterium RIFCSPHIGHO2_01_FULL_46_14]|uniref:Uncharacterized protein n=1 Tax=Candidatus Doudnabacteria bacterium RIFCSPHIGHO2_01_FULL_46_14 TaxID=1817824 RepID=A0A1F5NN41_9BACT|nr:MAG: hypothetical protein A2751_05655 [Candidatus Doudnabacteria bacterium RIFCSPHIGHO2_01_FULL_46_14]
MTTSVVGVEIVERLIALTVRVPDEWVAPLMNALKNARLMTLERFGMDVTYPNPEGRNLYFRVPVNKETEFTDFLRRFCIERQIGHKVPVTSISVRNVGHRPLS